jgi:hypothetical protein
MLRAVGEGDDGEMPFVKTPKGTRIKVGIVRDRIEIRRPKGIKIYIKQYDKEILTYIKARIVEDLESGEDFLVKVTGPRRKGKSTVAMTIAQSLSPITTENVVYTAAEFAKLATMLPISDPSSGRFSIIVFDETGHGMMKQRWYEHEQQEVVRLMEVNAAKRLVVFFVSPHNDWINSALQSPTMCKMWIDVGISQRYGKGMATVWTGLYHQFRASGFWNPLCAFTFEPLAGDFWEAYEVKKMQFIDTAGRLAMTSRQHTTRIERLLTALKGEIE